MVNLLDIDPDQQQPDAGSSAPRPTNLLDIDPTTQGSDTSTTAGAQPNLLDIDPSGPEQTPAETIQQLQPVLTVPSVAETVTQGVQDLMGIPRMSAYRVPGTEETVLLPETARRPDIGVAGYAADFASGMFEGGQDLVQFATRAIGGKYGIEDDGFRPMEDFKPGDFVPQNFVNQMFYYGGQLMLPGMALKGGAKLTGAQFKRAYDAFRKRFTNENPSASPLHSSQTRLGPPVSKTRTMVEAGVYGAAAEQIINSPEELAQPQLTEIFAKTLIESEYGFLPSIGRKLARAIETDDSEGQRRLLKLAEDLSVGLIFDGTTYAASFTGRKVLQKIKDRKAAQRQAELLPGEEDPVPAGLSREQLLEEAQRRAAQKEIPADLSEEDLKEAASYISQDNYIALEKLLDARGALDEGMRKYLGSINAQLITNGDANMYAVLKHYTERAAAETDVATKATPLAATKAMAIEFGFKNEEELATWLTKTQNSKTTPLKVYSDVAGLELSPDLAGVTTYVVASRMMLARSASHLIDMARDAKAAQKSGDPLRITATKASVVQAYAAHRKIQTMVNGQANEAGRLLNSFNLPVEGSYKATYLANMIKEGGDDFEKLIDDIASSSDADIATTLSRIDDNKSTWRMRMQEYFYNSILSAPDTLVVNGLGTLGVRIIRDYVETPLAASISELRKKMFGPNAVVDPGGDVTFQDAKNRIVSQFKREGIGTYISDDDITERAVRMVQTKQFDGLLGGEFNTMQELTDHLKNKGFADPMVEIRRLAKKELETDAMVGMANMMRSLRLAGLAFMERIPKGNTLSDNTNEMIMRGGSQAIEGKAGKFIRLPLRTMLFTDTFFKSLSQNAALHEGAGRLLRKMAHEIEQSGQPQVLKFGKGKDVVITKEMLDPKTADGQAYAQLMHRLVSNPPPELLAYAQREMLQDVFQQVTPLSKLLGRARGVADRTIPGLGTITVPFVQTPLNLAIYTMDRIPLIAMYSAENRSAARNPGYAKDLNTARKAFGVSMLTLGYLLADEGVATGSADFSSRRQYGLERASGYRSNAYIGEDGVAYVHGRGDPFSTFLSLGATIKRSMQAFADGEGLLVAERNDILKRTALAAHELYNGVITIASDKTFLGPVNELARQLTNPYSDENPIKTLFFGVVEQYAGTAGAAIPMSQLVARVSEALYEMKVFDEDRDFSDLYELGADRTIQMRKQGLEMADIAFNHNPVLRETAIFVEALKRGGLYNVARATAYKATERSPAVQRYLAQEVFNSPIFPRINQFGFEQPRDRPVNFLGIPGVPVSRTQGTPVMDNTQPGVVQGSETAGLAAYLKILGVEDFRVDRTISFDGLDKKIPLDAETYYYRSVIQGSNYYSRVSDYYKRGLDRGATKEEAVAFIEAAQTFAKQHADAQTKLYLVKTGKLDEFSEKEKERIIKEADNQNGNLAMSFHIKLEEIIRQREKSIYQSDDVKAITPTRIEIE